MKGSVVFNGISNFVIRDGEILQTQAVIEDEVTNFYKILPGTHADNRPPHKQKILRGISAPHQPQLLTQRTVGTHISASRQPCQRQHPVRHCHVRRSGPSRPVSV
ncbi:hypothetical protein RND71_003413 [Anisodus tanguticus]|uniref:Uncharacterized protein n=1 Tax=Anisodus tanguticus TaxID=243964 RepID=A0AAE1SXV2_9SOLA|nr:hypothetical protein RND71_003413 [Anisodus tanguticus]